jgi:hypothetical protein
MLVHMKVHFPFKDVYIFFTILHASWYIFVTWYFILARNVLGASYQNYCEEHFGRTVMKKNLLFSENFCQLWSYQCCLNLGIEEARMIMNLMLRDVAFPQGLGQRNTKYCLVFPCSILWIVMTYDCNNSRIKLINCDNNVTTKFFNKKF